MPSAEWLDWFLFSTKNDWKAGIVAPLVGFLAAYFIGHFILDVAQWTIESRRTVAPPHSLTPKLVNADTGSSAAVALPMPQKPKGEIHLIMGPMFSGKTRELLRRIDVKRIASQVLNMKCVLIKHIDDTRYGGKDVTVTHNRTEDRDCRGFRTLADAEQYVQGSRFVFIDEGQFFNDLLAFCKRWAKEGREVVVAALDAYDNQKMWKGTADLIPWCTTLQKLNAVCVICAGEASLTIPAEGRVNGEETKIGGKDMYRAACLSCETSSQSA